MISGRTSSSPSTIRLIIYYTNRSVVTVNVLPSSPVGDIRQMTRLRDWDLICNGQILSDAITFESYGICSKDTIIALPSTRADTETRRWVAITRDSDAFHERLRLLMNEKTGNESARIHDVAMTKYERRPRAFRKLCVTAQSALNPTTSQISLPSMTGYEPASEPNCAAMPFSWDTMSLPGTSCCISTGSANVDVKPDQPDTFFARPITKS
jgi:hypothetical protein